MSLQFIKESGTEGIAEKSVIEMFYIAPVGIVTVAALWDQAIDMRIPFEVPSKSVQDHNEAGGKVFGFVHLME